MYYTISKNDLIKNIFIIDFSWSSEFEIDLIWSNTTDTFSS